MKIIINSVANYKGHSLKENGNIDLILHFKYDELCKSIQLAQMLNNDVNLKVKLADKKPMNLGMFRIKAINIESDGESTLKLNSTNDFVEVDSLNTLVTKELFKVNFAADIESEEGEEDGE